MAVSVNQTIVFWDRKAREMLGYTAQRMVGAKCSEITSGLGRSGLTPECAGCCACMRYARAGLAPPAVGTVVTYLFRERVSPGCRTDVAPPVGDLVVVEQDDGADPQALTGVPAESHVQPLTPPELEVLRLLALGSEHEYIATELEATIYTVRSHVANLRRKLNAKSRFEAVMTATRLGILSLREV